MNINWNRLVEDEVPWELPWDKPIIHPTMPLLLCERLAMLCNDMNMSIWDRDKVYEALTHVQPRPVRRL